MIIDRLKIKGYKRFNDFEIQFNDKLNVLIGDNESGKSTILEAIDIVLNQRIFNYTDANFEQYFNNEIKEKFKNKPIFNNLPEIHIELFFKSKVNSISQSDFSGHVSTEKKDLNTGISFVYKFNEDFKKDFDDLKFNKDNVFIPTDYYSASWRTFSGVPYLRRKRPVKMLFIDGTKRHNNIFNSYSKQVFNNKISNDMKIQLSHSFKENLNNFITENKTDLMAGEYTFGIDDDKTYIENLIDLKADNVSLQHKGKGIESLIKTYIALENESDVILIEEPENHLSHTNTRKLIEEIRNSEESSQIIMTTHSPLVVSRMNLTNTIWLRNNNVKRLNDISKESDQFFRRTDNMDVLNFILSEKAIIVEGHSEYILLPQLIKNTFNKTVDDFEFNIFSGGGITYKHFIEVSKIIKNKLLIITDNDKSEQNIENIKKSNKDFIENGLKINIVCDESIDHHTFEVCLYNKNKDLIESSFDITPGTKAEFEGVKMPKKLAYMLKNKTLSAMKLAEEYEYRNQLDLPTYIEDGVKWLNQN